MQVWICIDEDRTIYGVFDNETDAKEWADRFNRHPKFDGVIRVFEYIVAHEGWALSENADKCFEGFMCFKN